MNSTCSSSGGCCALCLQKDEPATSGEAPAAGEGVGDAALPREGAAGEGEGGAAADDADEGGQLDLTLPSKKKKRKKVRIAEEAEAEDEAGRLRCLAGARGTRRDGTRERTAKLWWIRRVSFRFDELSLRMDGAIEDGHLFTNKVCWEYAYRCEGSQMA